MDNRIFSRFWGLPQKHQYSPSNAYIYALLYYTIYLSSRQTLSEILSVLHNVSGISHGRLRSFPLPKLIGRLVVYVDVNFRNNKITLCFPISPRRVSAPTGATIGFRPHPRLCPAFDYRLKFYLQYTCRGCVPAEPRPKNGFSQVLASTCINPGPCIRGFAGGRVSGTPARLLN